MYGIEDYEDIENGSNRLWLWVADKKLINNKNV